MDDIRPKGTGEGPCASCPVGENGERWYFWVDALDPRLPDGPFICPTCINGDKPLEKETVEGLIQQFGAQMCLDIAREKLQNHAPDLYPPLIRQLLRYTQSLSHTPLWQEVDALLKKNAPQEN